MHDDEIWLLTSTERRRTADLLAALPEDAWEVPSLCEGWRVRDVAAHLTLSARARPLQALLGVIRHGGNPNRWVAADAVARSWRPPAELVGELRAVADIRHRPPGTKTLDPLVDVIVHTQDIAVPLGIEHRVHDPAGAASAADRVWAMGFPFFARRRLRGMSVVATDVDWERGQGPLVEGPIAAILPMLAGRRAGVVDRLSGPGVNLLRSH